MPPARLTIQDDAAIIRLDQPPVNAINRGMRAALAEAFAAASQPGIRAIVLFGENGVFSAGADVNEIEKGLGTLNFYETLGEPNANDVFNAIENSPVPVVAAISGPALGGGLELALACHYRVAARDAKFGLTEAGLGIMPGAGGTQRLPRLVGVQKALSLMMAGAIIDAATAQDLGLLDRIVEGDLLAAAIAFGGSEAASPPPRVRDRNERLAGIPDSVFDEALAQAARAPHLLGPQRIVEAVRLARDVDFAEGLAREWDFFRECAASPAASGLIHQFLAERKVWKVPGLSRETSVRTIDRAAVIGSGTMGSGIAMSLLDAGIAVSLLDESGSSLEKGLQRIRAFYEGSVAKGRLSGAKADAARSLLSPVRDYTAITDVGLVIEAVFERMDVKRAVFAQLDRHVRPGAILATNTSTLDVNEIAAATARPQDVIGLHFFSPANIMRLVEIVRHDKTSDEALATVQALCRRMGKIGVVVGVCDGFVGNRMVDPYLREAQQLLLEGESPAQVDAALTDFGLAMGVFAMLDMAGLDIRWDVEKRRIAEGNWDPTAPMLINALFEAGRFGQKNGAGFFRYEDGSRRALPDPAVDAYVTAEAARLAVPVRSSDADEIVRRCLYGMINEAAKILEEGIALRASDIDVIYVAGYGFPAWRGGPMHYADRVGLANLLSTIRDYHQRYGDRWRPSDLLVRLGEEGGSFGLYDRRLST